MTFVTSGMSLAGSQHFSIVLNIHDGIPQGHKKKSSFSENSSGILCFHVKVMLTVAAFRSLV